MKGLVGLGLLLFGTIAAACVMLAYGLAFMAHTPVVPVLLASGSGGLILFVLLMLLFRKPDQG